MKFVQWNFNNTCIQIQDIIDIESTIEKGTMCIKLKTDKTGDQFSQTIKFDGIIVYITDNITVRYTKVNGKFKASFGTSVPTSPTKRNIATVKEANTCVIMPMKGCTESKQVTTNKAKATVRKRFKIPKKTMSSLAQTAYMRRSQRVHTSFKRKSEQQDLMNKDDVWIKLDRIRKNHTKRPVLYK